MKMQMKEIKAVHELILASIFCLTIIFPVALSGQEPAKPVEPTKTLSIADKAKYQITQLELSNAVKDVQLAQMQAQQQTQQLITEPIRTLNAKIADILRGLGVKEDDLQNWIYDPSTYTFTHKPAPQPINTSSDKK